MKNIITYVLIASLISSLRTIKSIILTKNGNDLIKSPALTFAPDDRKHNI